MIVFNYSKNLTVYRFSFMSVLVSYGMCLSTLAAKHRLDMHYYEECGLSNKKATYDKWLIYINLVEWRLPNNFGKYMILIYFIVFNFSHHTPYHTNLFYSLN